MTEKNMVRVTEEFNVKKRIKELEELYGWSDYRLAENAGLARSTISRWWSDDAVISEESIYKVYKAFHLTRKEFYNVDIDDPEIIEIKLTELQDLWDQLRDSDKKMIRMMIEFQPVF